VQRVDVVLHEVKNANVSGKLIGFAERAVN